jgi:hypothetical protein
VEAQRYGKQGVIQAGPVPVCAPTLPIAYSRPGAPSSSAPNTPGVSGSQGSDRAGERIPGDRLLPGRRIAGPVIQHALSASRLAIVDTRNRRALGCTPTERIAADRSAIVVLPPVGAPGHGMSLQIQRDQPDPAESPSAGTTEPTSADGCWDGVGPAGPASGCTPGGAAIGSARQATTDCIRSVPTPSRSPRATPSPVGTSASA